MRNLGTGSDWCGRDAYVAPAFETVPDTVVEV